MPECNLQIVSVKRRYWWPHPIYMEARKYRYACYRTWVPFVDVVVDYRYFVDGQPFDLVKMAFSGAIPLQPGEFVK